MNQYDLILGYIEEHGSITPAEAFMYLGITKLSTRIGEMSRNGFLKKKGIKLTKKMVEAPNRYGKTCRFMQYGKAA